MPPSKMKVNYRKTTVKETVEESIEALTENMKALDISRCQGIVKTTDVQCSHRNQPNSRFCGNHKPKGPPTCGTTQKNGKLCTNRPQEGSSRCGKHNK